mmetsp:Transcript_49980/g.82874  ORF Transcript_49980/g.82874 Transcript_49980/m.82874 type:complete len:477 (-) Transcript_49980:357-1787(-)|eukprot:CAMPEP_0119312842 /NCGR_PEP_ID=MMETSP1333-20130426/27041_1 /TAXON_ID=418940 /ORGANISM="Scyphosphaera apsteinii, Strain RCC1455" /LENGTH=476 /DNA_ID=CAMNT_0007317515 /DNA_START=131 /DNA_END=1561 /DNA_ORIENTATION=-
MDLELATQQRSEEAYARVARLTVCYFYDLGEILVMEMLLRAPRGLALDGSNQPTLQLDERVAERLKFDPKKVRQFLAKLLADRLVFCRRYDSTATKVAAPAHGSRDSAEMPSADSVKCLWGIHYETLVDAVRFKIDSMERKLEEEKRKAGEVQQYQCKKPQCMAKINSLEISPLMIDYETGEVRCEQCGSELEELDNSEQTRSIEERRKAIHTELRSLIEALNDAEEFEPPVYVRSKREAAVTTSATDGTNGTAGDKPSQGAVRARGSDGAAATGTPDNSLGATKYRGPTKKAEAPVAAVPWMMSSTPEAASSSATSPKISSAQAEEAARQRAWQEAYRKAYMDREAELTTTRGAAPPTADGGREAQSVLTVSRAGMIASHDAKAGVNAQFAAACTHVDPRTDQLPDLGMAAVPAADSMEVEDAEQDDGDFEEEEVMVAVQGVFKPMSEISEDDVERMTEEEHQRYYQAYQEALED